MNSGVGDQKKDVIMMNCKNMSNPKSQMDLIFG